MRQRVNSAALFPDSDAVNEVMRTWVKAVQGVE